jgi:hypothetical protein
MRGYLSTGITLLATIVAGQACKKNEPAVRVDTTAVAAPAPVPLAVQTVELGKGVGPDKRVTTPTTTFGVRDTIHAAVSTTGAAPNATLGAIWTFGPGNKLVDSTTVPIAPSGPAVTEFHIIRTSPWPTGKYKVAILLNGQPTQEKEFEVKR